MAKQPQSSIRPQDPAWRVALRRQLGWTLLLKLAALFVLWFLFFSPAHRSHVTPDSVSTAIAVDVASQPGISRAEGNNHD